MANQYTSYYLYQKYEKRGDQDWLPCYPNIFSVDGEGTMPLVIKTENDPECGYTPPAEPIYRWYNMPITTDYVCDTCPALQYRWVNKDISTYYECVGTDKYYVQKRQYSYDSGTTWNDVVPEETQRGSLYESGSTDCGYVPPTPPQYRTTSGTPYCTGYDLYVNVYSQVSYDEGITWETTATTITLVQENSPQCGYVPSYENQYLTFVAVDDNCQFVFYSGGTSALTIGYSLDSGATWNNLNFKSYSPAINAGQKIMWRRAGVSGGHFESNGTKFEVEGNAYSLVYGSAFTGVTSLSGRTRALVGVFSGCNITSIDNLALPAITLSDYCYDSMFKGCKQLTDISNFVLPATSLTRSCYADMFYGCTNLTVAPTLSATTLGYMSYYEMFRGCTRLTEAPALSATTLENYCCQNMFYGCSGMTTPMAILPATTLSSYCYDDMFNGCYSLTTAPELPAPTLVSYCYNKMFYNCINLSYIKCLATSGINTNSSTTNWVSGVPDTSGGGSRIFVKDQSASWSRGVNGIPTYWTVQDA